MTKVEKNATHETSLIILKPDEEEFRVEMLKLFKRELWFIEHRGIRTRTLANFKEEEITAFKDIFENCIEKINFLRDGESTIVGWDIKNEIKPCTDLKAEQH